MASKNAAQVLIAGKIITISGYESEEYLQKVANYLNNKITELSELPGYNRQPVEYKNLLLNLNIADDYFKVKKQAELLEEDNELRDKENYDLKHEIISEKLRFEEIQEEIEKLRKENSELKEKVQGLESKNSELNQDLNDLLKK